MRPQVRDAITRAYVNGQAQDDADYRLLSRDEAEAIVAELRSRCTANVTYSDDPNYATSYRLEITESGVPTPSERAASGAGHIQLPGTHYLLVVSLSWLGPFAMRWWGRYEEGKDPVALSEPEREQDRELEACVQRVLDERGIVMLDDAELAESVPEVDILTLDGEQPTVASLLFALYL
jgi:hypothetical protein